MEKFITKEEAKEIKFTLKNSKGKEFEFDLLEAIEAENYNSQFFPNKVLEGLENPKEGDWVQILDIPMCNGIFNPETGENEFCEPYWKTNDGGLYSADVYISTLFCMNDMDAWYYPISYIPPKFKDKHWDDFKVPLFPEEE